MTYNVCNHGKRMQGALHCRNHEENVANDELESVVLKFWGHRQGEGLKGFKHTLGFGVVLMKIMPKFEMSTPLGPDLATLLEIT